MFWFLDVPQQYFNVALQPAPDHFVTMTLLRLIPYHPQGSREEPPSTSEAAKIHSNMDDWPVDHNETMSPASPFTGESSNRTDYAPSDHSPATSYTSAMLDSPGPPLLDKPATLSARLKDAIQTARDAETIHAYDVGICAAIQSMTQYWSSRAAQRHISRSEKRIFRREAQRLQELMEEAKKELDASQADLVTWQKEEDRLREQISFPCSRKGSGKDTSGEAQGMGVDADVDESTLSIEHAHIQNSPGLGVVRSKVRDVEARGVAMGETAGSCKVPGTPGAGNVKMERG